MHLNTSEDVSFVMMFNITEENNVKCVFSDYQNCGINNIGDFNKDGNLEIASLHSCCSGDDTLKCYSFVSDSAKLLKDYFLVLKYRIENGISYIDLKHSKWFFDLHSLR